MFLIVRLYKNQNLTNECASYSFYWLVSLQVYLKLFLLSRMPLVCEA
jgi:hypothetical protein